MKQDSRRAKGKKLQRIVRDKLLLAFPDLHQGHIRVAKAGQQGEDLKLSRIARRLIPYQFECKNQEKFKGIYSIYSQAEGHKGKGEPLIILKMNRQKPLVIMDFDFFLGSYKGDTK